MVLEYEGAGPSGVIKIRLSSDGEGITSDFGSTFRGGSERVLWRDVVAAGVGRLSIDLGSVPQGGEVLREMAAREFVFFGCRRRRGRPEVKGWGLPPTAEERAALVAELRSRLGARWREETLDHDAFARSIGVSRLSGLRTALIVLAVVFVGIPLVIALGSSVLALLFNRYTQPFWSLAAGVSAFVLGFRDIRTRFVIRNTPTAKASSAAIGLAELSGRARAIEPTAAPVSGVPSAFWAVRVERYQTTDDGSSWSDVALERSAPLQRFELEDESGRISVWARGSDLILTSRVWQSDEPGSALPDAGRAFLAQRGLVWEGEQRLRVHELRLGDDDPVFVLGSLAERRDVSDSAAAEPRVFAGAGRARRRLHAAGWRTAEDVPFARWIERLPASLREVIFALLELRAASAREQATRVGPPGLAPESVLVWRGAGSRPFVIADHSERAALEHVSQRALAGVGVGALLMAWGVASGIALLVAFGGGAAS